MRHHSSINNNRSSLKSKRQSLRQAQSKCTITPPTTLVGPFWKQKGKASGGHEANSPALLQQYWSTLSAIKKSKPPAGTKRMHHHSSNNINRPSLKSKRQGLRQAQSKCAITPPTIMRSILSESKKSKPPASTKQMRHYHSTTPPSILIDPLWKQKGKASGRDKANAQSLLEQFSSNNINQSFSS